jgi:hypothetical protein
LLIFYIKDCLGLGAYPGSFGLSFIFSLLFPLPSSRHFGFTLAARPLSMPQTQQILGSNPRQGVRYTFQCCYIHDLIFIVVVLNDGEKLGTSSYVSLRFLLMHCLFFEQFREKYRNRRCLAKREFSRKPLLSSSDDFQLFIFFEGGGSHMLHNVL